MTIKTIKTAIGGIEDPTDRFFAYARERHSIYLRRASGAPRPWTDDQVLGHYRFTNVFRELDAVTLWFKKNVREPLRARPEVLLATVIFRMFNRIDACEAIFCQIGFNKTTAFEEYLDSGKSGHLRRAVRLYCGGGPYVTGAYIISTPPGYSKLDGVLRIVDNFNKRSNWRDVAEGMLKGLGTGELWSTWCWLKQHDYLGTFHSYEIVTDLRHTALLERASDAMTWANVGPGAQRGLNRIHKRGRAGEGRGMWNGRVPTEQAIDEMRELLRLSDDAAFWPQVRSRGKSDWTLQTGSYDLMLDSVGERDWPRWELREVEHTLCEFDKYERARLGEGRPRGVFR